MDTHLRAQLQTAVSTASTVRPPDPAEIQKLRAEWHREQKGLEQEHNQRRAELVGLRSQLGMVQQKLEAEMRARQLEGSQAFAKIATLQKELAAAGKVIEKAQDRDSARERIGLRLSAAAITAAVIVSLYLVWAQFFGAVPGLAGPDSKRVAPVPAAPKVSPPVQSARAGESSPPAFSQSLVRLSETLASLPGKPEDILRSVRARDKKVCAFSWNGGQPALLYQSGGLSLSGTLNGCADAVEKYRASHSD